MVDVGNSNENNKDMAYDLRQIYAKIVGEHMTDVAEARRSSNYGVWLENLEDLYTVIAHKFKEATNNTNVYNKLIKEISDVANANISEWTGKSHDSKKVALIQNKLRELERFLYAKMEEANMFGQKYTDDDDDL